MVLCLHKVYTKVKENSEKSNMNRPIEQINVSSTLRQMKVNSTVLFPAEIKWSTIRTIAGMFKRAGQSAYSVKKIEGGYEVTRIR
jgi:hypothetical protein